MRKIIISLLTVVFLILIFPLSLVKANHAACPDLVCGPPYACTGGQCSDCTCESDPCVDNEDTPYDECVGGSGGGSCNGQYTCGPGFYCSNSGCTEVGGGGSSYRPAACRNATVNCPAGQTIATNHPLNTFCEIDGGLQMCAPKKGSAQRSVYEVGSEDSTSTMNTNGQCCNSIGQGGGISLCANPLVTTYGCCPTGQTPNVTLIPGAIYTEVDSCLAPRCNDSDDVLISSVDYNPPPICITTCPSEVYTIDGTCKGGVVTTCTPAPNSICYFGGINVGYNLTNTCRTMTPSYTCTGAVNGVCSSTHYNCAPPGTATNPVSGATTWTWSCVGTAGGTTASCSENKPVVVSLPVWWQVKDGDVTAQNGDISSTVPVASLFDTNGSGGFPGVPVYSGGLNKYNHIKFFNQLKFGMGLVSSIYSSGTIFSNSLTNIGKSC